MIILLDAPVTSTGGICNIRVTVDRLGHVIRCYSTLCGVTLGGEIPGLDSRGVLHYNFHSSSRPGLCQVFFSKRTPEAVVDRYFDICATLSHL